MCKNGCFLHIFTHFQFFNNVWVVGRIVNSRRVDNPGAPPQINRHTFFQDSYLYLPRTFVVDAPYMRRTLAVHASAKAAFFMLNIENTAFADVYTAHLRLRYDEGTAKVGLKVKAQVRPPYPLQPKIS